MRATDRVDSGNFRLLIVYLSSGPGFEKSDRLAFHIPHLYYNCVKECNNFSV